METVSLRTLVREPLKVKRMTRRGNSVQVTDRGEALWILKPAKQTEACEKKRNAAIDEVLEEVKTGKPSKTSLSEIILQSRR